MAKFEESRPSHEVHEISKPQGHGYMDQKHQKGMRSPIAGSVPSVDNGTVPNANGVGAPGMPSGQYGSGSPTGTDGGAQ